MSTKWSPGVMRAMHETSDGAPPAPSFDDLRAASARPADRGVRPLTLAAAAMVVLALVGLTVLAVRRHDSISGPAPAAGVHHERYEVTITGTLECDQQVDRAGTFSSFVVDSWSDRSNRRWRTVLTFPDGTTRDTIITGSIVAAPDQLLQRGTYRGTEFACVVDGETVPLSTDFSREAFFTLNPEPELGAGERPLMRTFRDMAAKTFEQQPDDQGRMSVRWDQDRAGSVAIGTRPPVTSSELRSWWVEPERGLTVTQQRVVTTIDGLGTSTVTQVLTSSETLPDDPTLFATDGFASVESATTIVDPGTDLTYTQNSEPDSMTLMQVRFEDLNTLVLPLLPDDLLTGTEIDWAANRLVIRVTDVDRARAIVDAAELPDAELLEFRQSAVSGRQLQQASDALAKAGLPLVVVAIASDRLHIIQMPGDATPLDELRQRITDIVAPVPFDLEAGGPAPDCTGPDPCFALGCCTMP
jgi:hypothetical protein